MRLSSCFGATVLLLTACDDARPGDPQSAAGTSGAGGSGGAPATCTPAPKQNGAWSYAGLMPDVRSTGAALMPDGRIILGPGFGSGPLVSLHEPLGETWTTAQSFPKNATEVRLATGLDGKIYAFGGLATPTTGAVDVFVYDPPLDKWAKRADMPTPRRRAGIATGPDGKIYAFGGDGGECERYDPSADAWEVLPSMPTPRTLAGAATALDGRIVVVGGENPDGNTTTNVDLFDPTTQGWEAGPALPEPIGSAAVVRGLDGRIYVIGGRDTVNSAPETIHDTAYVLEDYVWYAAGTLAKPRTDFGAAPTTDGRVLIFGGWSNNNNPDIEQYGPLCL